MLGEQRGIERDFPGPIRERVHAAPQEDHLPLRGPTGQLQPHSGSTVGKRLHQQGQVETDQAAHKIGQIGKFHMR